MNARAFYDSGSWGSKSVGYREFSAAELVVQDFNGF